MIYIIHILIFMFNIVRSKLPDFSLQMNSSRSIPRQLLLPRSTSEEKPGIRDSSIEGFSMTSALWRLKGRRFTPDKYTHQTNTRN